MCGRYSNARTDSELAQHFQVAELVGPEIGPSWNVAPTQNVRAVLERQENGADIRQLRTFRWGLVPSWAKDVSIGNRMINARVETITEKPAFRRAAARRRAIVPMDGYYEWQKPEEPKGRKTPHYLVDPDGAPLAAAGLYELWPDPAKADDDPDRWLWSLTVITTAATDTLGHIHDRSPLLLPSGLWGAWLDPDVTETNDVHHLLSQIPEPHLKPIEVSPAVGNVRNNSPALITRTGT